MARIAKIEKWLESGLTANPTGTYRHRVLKENPTEWAAVEPGLKKYFRLAHADAVRRLRRLATGSLHPIKKKGSPTDPAKNYPHAFEMTTCSVESMFTRRGS
jgi:hypothetical protein